MCWHGVEPKATDFIPLKDLLRKNHGDRVQDYMDKMKHMSIDEIVNSKASLEDKSQAQTAGMSQRQKTIVNNAHQRPRGKFWETNILIDIMSLESKKHETVDSTAF